MDHGVGRRQVETAAAGLEAEQEHRHLAILEALHRGAPIPGFAGQGDVRDAALVEIGGDEVEHAGELGEHQDPAATGEQGVEALVQRRQFRRGLGHAGVFVGHQAQVAADLAQAQQGIEDQQLAATDALAGDLGADTFVQQQAQVFVAFALRCAEFDQLDDLGLGRQLAGDPLLGAAQHEGSDPCLERRQALHIAFALHGDAIGLLEAFLVAQPAGHQEVELRPEFAQVIFQRRAGQAEAMAGAQVARRLGGLGGGILDRLGFVEHLQVEVVAGQALGVTG